MARIPVYQPMTRAGEGTDIRLPRTDAEAFGAGVGAGMEQLGGAISRDAMRRRREAAEAADNAAMTSASKDVADAWVATRLFAEEAQQTAAADGSGHVDGVLADLDARRDAVLGNIQNERARQWAERRFNDYRADLEWREGSWAAGMRAAKVRRDAAESRDLLRNILFTSPNRADLDKTIATRAEWVDMLALPADAREKLKSEDRQLFAESYARGLAEQDPYALRREIDNGSLNALLAPDAIATLRNRADSEIRGREAEAAAIERQRQAEIREAKKEAREAEKEQRDAVLGTARDMLDSMRDGVIYQPEEVAAVIGAAARLPGGAALARNLQTLAVRNGTAIQLRGASPRQVQDVINQLEPEAAKGDARAPILNAQLAAARSALAALNSGLQRDPLSTGVKQGVHTLQPLDLNDPASVRQREKDARTNAAWSGRKMVPLTAAEAAEFGQHLTSGDPQRQLGILMQLENFSGPFAAAALEQIAPDAPLATHAGNLAKLGGGPMAASTLLNGAAALTRDQKLVPRDVVESRIESQVGNALLHMRGLRDVLLDGTRAWLAGRGRETGSVDTSRAAVNRAVNSVLGGAMNDRGVMQGGLGERHGQRVLLPDGKTERLFNRAIDNFSLAEALRGRPDSAWPVWGKGKHRFTDLDIRRAHPFAVGDNHYIFSTTADGQNIIMRGDGTPFEMRIK